MPSLTRKVKKVILYMALASLTVACTENSAQNAEVIIDSSTKKNVSQRTDEKPALDTAQYNKLLRYISRRDSSGRWPVKTAYPSGPTILPFKRIVAYYGNLYSKQMGVLGEYPKQEMIRRLKAEVDKWTKADSVIPAIPALHYIAVTAQGSPGKGNTYRLRMPFKQIDTIISWAREINALIFIDIQTGQSTIQKELPEFEKYLAMPDVHLGIDPEFSMKTGKAPGTVIGSMDAADINYASNYLAEIVKKYNIPPKIFVIHRFTQPMVTNYKQIKLHPEVQFIMDMDGWGLQARKVNTYKSFIYPEPVQYTGFKIFYKNDTKRVNAAKEMQPADVLKLTPQPLYIQYQ
jgi:hypothetical protein